MGWSYEERKAYMKEYYLKYREANRELLKQKSREYYNNKTKQNNIYYNYNKKHSKDIYYKKDTKKEKEKKLLYIMNYFISNNIIWT